MNRDKLKIAFLHRADDIYAIQRIKLLLKADHLIFSIILPGKDFNLLDDPKLRVICLKKAPLSFSVSKRIIYKNQIDKILNEIKPDVFHVVSALNLYYCKSRIANITIIENQGSDVIVAPKSFPPIKYFYSTLYKYVDGVIQDSYVARIKGIECGAPTESEKNKVIDNGIDFNIFNKNIPKNVFSKKYNLESRPIIFSSRSLKKLYNPDIVFRSITEVKKVFPSIIYVFAAPHGSLNKKNKKYINRNNINDNVLFLDFVNHDNEMKYIYRDSNITISVPSSDSSPASVYESMACYTPVIASDLSWVHDNFIADKDLVIIPPRNSKKLAETIIQILSKKMSTDLESAFKKVYENKNYEFEGEKLYNFYVNLLNSIGNKSQIQKINI